MSQRRQQIKRVRRYLFVSYFAVSLALVGRMVEGRYDSAVEIIPFTLIGATVATVFLSLLSIPFVLLGVWTWNKYLATHAKGKAQDAGKPERPTDCGVSE